MLVVAYAASARSIAAGSGAGCCDGAAAARW